MMKGSITRNIFTTDLNWNDKSSRWSFGGYLPEYNEGDFQYVSIDESGLWSVDCRDIVVGTSSIT